MEILTVMRDLLTSVHRFWEAEFSQALHFQNKLYILLCQDPLVGCCVLTSALSIHIRPPEELQKHYCERVINICIASSCIIKSTASMLQGYSLGLNVLNVKWTSQIY